MDMTSIRASFAAAMFGDVATRLRDGAPDLQVPGLFAARRMQQDRSQAVAVPLGAYTFKCAIGSDVQAGDTLIFAGRSYRVVYDPPPSALSLGKVIGMDGL